MGHMEFMCESQRSIGRIRPTCLRLYDAEVPVGPFCRWRSQVRERLLRCCLVQAHFRSVVIAPSPVAKAAAGHRLTELLHETEAARDKGGQSRQNAEAVALPWC